MKKFILIVAFLLGQFIAITSCYANGLSPLSTTQRVIPAEFLHFGSVSSYVAPTTNSIYPFQLDQHVAAGYSCGTSYYVSNNSKGGTEGSNSYSSTQAQNIATPWLTIAYAEAQLTGSYPNTCITVLPGVYGDTGVGLGCHGTTNSTTGYCTLRCATSVSAKTAQPVLYQYTAGAQGSNPACQVTSTSNPYGFFYWDNGSVQYNYSIIDGFEIGPGLTASASASSIAYTSSSGLVTLTFATSPGFEPGIGFVVSGVTGTGCSPLNSVGSADFWAATGTSGTTVYYYTTTGLGTLTCSGGTVTYPSGGEQGVGSGTSNLTPGSHHIVAMNMLIHDIGYQGLSAISSDAIVFFANVLYNDAWQNGYDGSNITIFTPVDASFTAGALDGTYGTTRQGITIKNLIVDNITHHSGNLTGGLTDGNGIELDHFNSTTTACGVSTYAGGTLDALNLSYGNGGRANELNSSSNVELLNNAAFADIQYLNAPYNSKTNPEITSACSAKVDVQNNVSYAVTGANIYSNGNLAAIDYNVSTIAADYESVWQANLLYTSGNRNNADGCPAYPACTDQPNYNFIGTAALAPAVWSSGTTYAQYSYALGSDGNVYSSLAAGNIGHNPLTDNSGAAIPVGGQGANWQNDGLPNNYQAASQSATAIWTNPSVNTPTNLFPNFTLVAGSPALGTGTQAITSLGGLSVNTPNKGPW